MSEHPTEAFSAGGCEVSAAAVGETVLVGLGSNLGDRLATLQGAVEALQDLACEEVLCSSVWETAAVGFVHQPSFLNAVVALRTGTTSHTLLERLLATERQFGRSRAEDDRRWGPRTLDLDLLFFGQHVVRSSDLCVPHPRLAERRFVLDPLCEIAPRWRHPVLGVPCEELLRRLVEEGSEPPGAIVRPRATRWWKDASS